MYGDLLPRFQQFHSEGKTIKISERDAREHDARERDARERDAREHDARTLLKLGEVSSWLDFHSEWITWTGVRVRLPELAG